MSNFLKSLLLHRPISLALPHNYIKPSQEVNRRVTTVRYGFHCRRYVFSSCLKNGYTSCSVLIVLGSDCLCILKWLCGNSIRMTFCGIFICVSNPHFAASIHAWCSSCAYRITNRPTLPFPTSKRNSFSSNFFIFPPFHSSYLLTLSTTI